MAKKADATLVVVGEADFSKLDQGIAQLNAKLNQMSKAQKGAGDSTKKTEQGLLDFAKGAQAAVAALAASQVVKFTVELVNLGAAAEQAELALNKMSDGEADEYVKAIASASQYTISSMDAMSIAARSLRMGIVGNADEMAHMTEVAMVMGQTMGISTTQALNDLSTGVARQSKLILDNLGILVDQEQIQSEVNRLMAEDAMLTKEAAQQKAWLNAVLAEGDALLAKTGGVMQTTATDVEVLKASWQELKIEMGKGAAEVFGPAIKNAADLSRMLRELKQAEKDFSSTTAYTADTVDEWVIGMANAGMASQELAHQIEAGVPPVGMAAAEYAELTEQFWELKRAEAELAGADPSDKLFRMAQAAEQAAASTAEVTQEVESEEDAIRRAEQAQRAYTDALRNQLRRQESIAGITADLVGQFDTLGRTFYSVVPANNEAASAAERYGENLEDLRDTAGQLAQDIQYLGDGEGALQAKLDETNAVIAQQEAAMASASSQAGDLRTAYTITQLTQEQLNLVGESFMDLLSATGNELLMTGKGYDDYRLKMQLATEEQIRMEHGQQLLMEALSAGRVSVEQAGDVYTAYVTGQVADIEQAIATQEAHNEALAQVPGLLAKMDEVGLGDIFAEAEEPTQTITDQFGAMSESVSQMAEMAPAAFEQLAELAPGVNEAMTPLQLSMTQIAGALTGMITTAPNWASAMNESFAALASEGSGVWQGTSLISGLYSDWLYLQQNPRLSLEAIVSITSTGSVPGAAGGADFIATKPTLLPVGELGLPERVTVKPMYNTAGIPPYNPSKGIGFAAGGTLTYPGSGGRAVINIGAINVSGVQSVRDIARELANGVLQRELRAAGFEIGRVA